MRIHELTSSWENGIPIPFHDLIIEEKVSDFLSKPYPFCMAYALENEISDIGDVKDWSMEHKWDGIRAQVIIRENQIFVWSHGEELVTDKYSEFEVFINAIPNGSVLDGEILPFKDLQTRIGRKTVSKALLAKTPVILKVYDLLEWESNDIRSKSFMKRRTILERLLESVSSKNIPLQLSPT